MTGSVDVVVIGGGIVGLALADAWLVRNSGDRVLVIDKEAKVGAHASGRNSGVLHAGFYYAPDSLKAQLTRRGNQQLREFCYERGVPIVESGKVVVAQSYDEVARIDALYQRGIANGCTLEVIDEAQLAEIEPLARTHGKALWSPLTAVSSPVGVTEALATRVVERGGTVRLGTVVTAAGPGWVEVNGNERINAGHIINAAGLYADRVAHWFGVGMDYRMLPFKGLYWYGNWPKGRLKRHVYPVPDLRNPFLGVHVTVTVDGLTKLGPTAIPALWREDYGKVSDIIPKESLEIAALYPRFLTSKHHDVPGLLRSEFPKYLRRYLVKQAQSLVPAVDVKDFKAKGKPGVRAQLLHLPTKKLEMDFVVEPGERSTHMLNAVSPAWTSALAVGEYVIERIHTDGFTRPIKG
ncbi:MAG: L-2-hydroxyglutarate oxidase [Candidatus Nanopelagicales bacterium]